MLCLFWWKMREDIIHKTPRNSTPPRLPLLLLLLLLLLLVDSDVNLQGRHRMRPWLQRYARHKPTTLSHVPIR